MKEIEERHLQIAEYVRAHPELKLDDIKKLLGISHSLLFKAMKKHNIRRPHGRRVVLDESVLNGQ